MQLAKRLRSSLKRLRSRLFAWPNLVKQVQKRKILRAIQLRPGDSLLDVGSAQGDILHYFKRRVPTASIVGGDLVERSRWSRYGHEISFHVFDAKALPFEDESFDRILLSEIVSIVDDADQVLQEASRVLKPGGRMVIVNGRGYRSIERFYHARRWSWLRRLLVRFTRLEPTYYAFYRAHIARNVSAGECALKERLRDMDRFLEDLIGRQPGLRIRSKDGAFNPYNELLLSTLQVARACFGLDRPKHNYFTLYPLALLLEQLPAARARGLSLILSAEKVELA